MARRSGWRSAWHLLGTIARGTPDSRSLGAIGAGGDPAAEVFPGMGPAAVAGLLIGAVLASVLGGMSGHGPAAILVRALLGAVAGGLLGALLTMLRTVEVPGRTLPVPTAGGRRDLWDPWLDEGGIEEGGPGDVEGGGDSRREGFPERAHVRPRVLSNEDGESMPLEDEILSLAKRGERGAVRIAGPPGAGKTTALRHLAAELPRALGVSVLDAPDPTSLAAQAACGLVVYAAANANDVAPTKPLATYRLAPWGDDERIEYLLGVARERCASVMGRLKGSADRDLIAGIPELWRIVLDRMAGDASVMGVRDALWRELVPRLADPELRASVEDLCLARLATPDAIPDELLARVKQQRGDARLLRLIRHRPIQVLIAAERIAAVLDGDAPCDSLRGRLPRDLVREAASLIRERPRALDRLEGVVDGGDRRDHAMAASLLHASRTGWRPRSTRDLRLSGAYLERVAWSGIDLRGVELQCADLYRADLSGATLDAARAGLACLRQADLRGASLQGAVANEADLTEADLSSIRAEDVQFGSAILERANLEAASLRRARLEGANLSAARLSRADLRGACLEGANIAGADFSGALLASAVLRGLKLSQADFTHAGFAGADLSGCDLEGMELPRAVFEDARLRGTLLTGSKMPGASFRGACLRDAGLAEVEWEGACLAHADLRGASFHLGSSRSGLVQSPIACEGSRTGFYTDDFNEQDFKPPEEIRKADLRGADLRGARIDGVDFYLVDLRGALFDAAQAEHLRRCGAILVDRC